MSNRIVLSDNLIERINNICKKRNITFEQFCTKAMIIMQHKMINCKKDIKEV